MAKKTLAQDRAATPRHKIAQDFAQIVEGSNRSKNEDGYLQVKNCPVMVAGVSPYYGYEIADDNPDIDPEKIYYAFRPPEEIEKAADTANGVPILIQHKADSASEPNTDLRVGSVGTSPQWDGRILRNTFTYTDERGIKAIEDRSLVEISPGYYYEVDWTKGEHNGVAYDFVMRNLRFNHVANVEEARQGPEMYVADEKPSGINPKAKGINMNRKKLAAKVAILSAIKPHMASDEAPDIDEQVVAKNGPKALANAVMKVIKPELSEDCDLDADDLAEVITAAQKTAESSEDEPEEVEAMDAFNPDAPADSVRQILEQSDIPSDVVESICAFIQGAHDDEKLEASDEDFEEPLEKADNTAEDEEETKSERREAAKLSEDAMNRRIEKMRREERERSNALHAAGEAVRSVLGSQNVFAFDSADDIYKKACQKMGMDTRGVPSSAFRHMFKVAQGQKAQFAQDEAFDDSPVDFDDHPGLKNISL